MLVVKSTYFAGNIISSISHAGEFICNPPVDTGRLMSTSSADNLVSTISYAKNSTCNLPVDAES